MLAGINTSHLCNHAIGFRKLQADQFTNLVTNRVNRGVQGAIESIHLATGEARHARQSVNKIIHSLVGRYKQLLCFLDQLCLLLSQFCCGVTVPALFNIDFGLAHPRKGVFGTDHGMVDLVDGVNHTHSVEVGHLLQLFQRNYTIPV